MIRYLRFLRDKSIAGQVTPGLLKAWFHFKEVEQTWLGFTESGNRGSGLGMKFARALNENFGKIFADEQLEVTEGHHLEKLSLISDGVGRDSISDFTTNLIKSYLCEFTRDFALEHVVDQKCGMLTVELFTNDLVDHSVVGDSRLPTHPAQ